MSSVAHIHNAEGQDIGYICGPPIPDATCWSRLLLRKFPCLDLSWPQEVQEKWWRIFDKLLQPGGNKTILVVMEALP